MARDKWVKIGTVGVDAGMVWIGDPCYILHQPSEQLAQFGLGKTWDEFVENLYDGADADDCQFEQTGAKDMKLGVAVRSGFGDGAYDVYAKIDHASGRIAEVKIKFI